MECTELSFENGDKVYIGSRYVGVWIGNNPITGSEVVYKERSNEFASYHLWQIKRYPVLSVPYSSVKSK